MRAPIYKVADTVYAVDAHTAAHDLGIDIEEFLNRVEEILEDKPIPEVTEFLEKFGPSIRGGLSSVCFVGKGVADTFTQVYDEFVEEQQEVEPIPDEKDLIEQFCKINESRFKKLYKYPDNRRVVSFIYSYGDTEILKSFSMTFVREMVERSKA